MVKIVKDYLDGSGLSKKDLLNKINQELDKRNLKKLNSLGDNKLGQGEITGIFSIHEEVNKYVTDVVFNKRFSDGKLGKHRIIFNANGKINDGAVVFTLINNKIVVVKQWRSSLGKYTYEIPRGFSEKLVSDKKNIKNIFELPIQSAIRELKEEVSSKLEIDDIIEMGHSHEDSGMSSTCISYFLIKIRTKVKLKDLFEKNNETQKAYLYSENEFENLIRNGTICDNHSITAFCFYKICENQENKK